MASSNEIITNEQKTFSRIGRLGKMPAKSSTKALLFATFLKAALPDPPKSYDFWKRRAPFPAPMYGNDTYGDCTIASQANAALRMERIETRHTPKFSDNALLTAYFNMTWRCYGDSSKPMPSDWDVQGDLGAYETDALDNWRNPDWTFKDEHGHPMTIEAYTRVNQLDQMEIKRAIWSQPSKGIKICWNLPAAWSNTISLGVWDAPPPGTPLVGIWMPGSWGGHSTYAYAYTDKGLWIRTWNVQQFVTWEGVAAYSDECHWVLDSVDPFRHLQKEHKGSSAVKLPDLIDAVNSVSSLKINT